MSIRIQKSIFRREAPKAGNNNWKEGNQRIKMLTSVAKEEGNKKPAVGFTEILGKHK